MEKKTEVAERARIVTPIRRVTVNEVIAGRALRESYGLMARFVILDRFERGDWAGTNLEAVSMNEMALSDGEGIVAAYYWAGRFAESFVSFEHGVAGLFDPCVMTGWSEWLPKDRVFVICSLNHEPTALMLLEHESPREYVSWGHRSVYDHYHPSVRAWMARNVAF